MLAHGLSIGGACAASLGVQHTGLRVTFDQAFASLAEVSLHVGRGLYDQLLVPHRLTLFEASRKALAAAQGLGGLAARCGC